MKAAAPFTRTLCLLFIVACALPMEAAQPAKPVASKDDTEQALAANKQRVKELDQWMSNANQQLNSWEGDLKKKDTEVTNIARQVEQASAALAQANRAITAIEAEQKALEVKRGEQAQRIAEHLAASYRMSGEDFVKLILNQQSPDQLNRLMRYHSYFTQARMGVIDDYQQTLDTMADNRFRLETQREDAAEKKQTLTDKQRTLGGERKERVTLIAKLSAEFKDKEKERDRLNADRARLEDLLAQLRRQSTELDGNAFVARRSTLPWPVNGKLTNAFGQPRADGRLTWTGVVIAADEGSPVQAVSRGRVVFARWLRGFGLLTIIDHGGGYMTLYGHADILLKTEGEWVDSGEIISRAGRSGGQSVSGVYFEVRHKGVARDPIGWLAKR